MTGNLKFTEVNSQTSATENDPIGRGQETDAVAKATAKASSKSEQVLKSVSAAHSEALKRLKDR